MQGNSPSSDLRNLARPTPSWPSPPVTTKEGKDLLVIMEMVEIQTLYRERKRRRSKNNVIVQKPTGDEDFGVFRVGAGRRLSLRHGKTLLGGRADDRQGRYLPAPSMLRCVSQQLHAPHRAPPVHRATRQQLQSAEF